MAVFYNKATLSYNGIVTDSNIVMGELVETVSITKTPLQTEYINGDAMTYVINLRNSGTTALTELSVTDNLGAYDVGETTVYPLTYVEGSIAYFVDGALQTTPAVIDTTGLTINGISIPAGGNAAIIYQARVNDYAPPTADGSVTNTAAVSGNGIVGETTATATINTQEAPRLSITKSLCPTTVTESGVIAYTFVIDNVGNTEAGEAANVVITDTFTPILKNIVVTLDGRVLEAGTDYTYDETTGVFSTVVGRITVPAADYSQDAQTGLWSVDPGTTTLVVSGTV